MSEKLTIVAGLSSGGTSIVAGILHHLGVNMGRIPEKIEDMHPDAQKRGYLSYECQDLAGRFRELNAGGAEHPAHIMGFYYMFKDYVRERLTVPGCHGVKYGGIGILSFAADPGKPQRNNVLKELPIQVVAVTRKLDDVFRSEWMVNGFSPQHTTHVAQGYYHLVRLTQIIPAIYHTTFERCLDDTQKEVDALSRALMLKPSREQFNAACDFVDQKNKGKKLAA